MNKIFLLLNENKNIFFLIFFSRLIFYLFSPYDNFELQPDSYWYDKQSDGVLRGNFNLLRPLFITAPFFSYFQALIKLIFAQYWELSLSIIQIIICAISSVYLKNLADIIFKNYITNAILVLLITSYPLTLWFSFTFTQDIWFQSFLIIFMYYFYKYLLTNCKKTFFLSIIFFSLTYLTKSHILLFSPFIVLSIFLKKNLKIKEKIYASFLFAILTFSTCIPYGIYNIYANNTFVISSSGLGGTFITGHNEEAYLNHVKKETLTNEQIKRFRDVKYKIFEDLKEKVKNQEPKKIQEIYFNEGISWVLNNKIKNLELAIYHLKSFFLPGINKFWYPYNIWLIVFLITCPIYFCAYFEVLINIKSLKELMPFYGLIISMLLFTVFFYYSGRFRVITLDPYYLIFCANFIRKYFYSILYDKK